MRDRCLPPPVFPESQYRLTVRRAYQGFGLTYVLAPTLAPTIDHLLHFFGES
jgi:hypothetical protein